MNTSKRIPDFDNMIKVARREKPSRPVLFEIFMNDSLYERFSGYRLNSPDAFSKLKQKVDAFAAAGYDYTSVYACDMSFPTVVKRKTEEKRASISLNDGCAISDWASFEAYPWPDPGVFSYDMLERIAPCLPGNMKLMVMGPGGVLENAFSLIGYDNLCYMLYDEPDLVKAVFDHIGERLFKYYRIAAEYQSVGILMSNDDWGFNTQTFLSVSDMRKLVFPWNKRIVEAAHSAGKLAFLHSCGNLATVMDDIIDDMRFDGKHSNEDAIMPVEDFYEQWGDRIAILGGIDVDFLARKDIDSIRRRAKGMLSRVAERGGYALGSGNSIPEYIPFEKYMAMIECAWNG